jgi:hypothetical protein
MTATNHTRYDLLNRYQSGATFKCLLLDTSTSYSFDRDADDYVSDLPTGAEPGDASYSRQPVTGLGVSEDDANDRAVLDADDVVFPSLSTSNDIQTVVVYRQVGGDDSTPGDDPIVTVFDDDSADSNADLPKATNGQDFTVELTDPLLRVTL